MRRLIALLLIVLLFCNIAYGGFGGYLQANTAVDLMVGPFVDDTDGKTAETGLTITEAEVFLSKNGGNHADKSEATSLSHKGLGNYLCKLDATDTNTEGILTLMIHESGALPIKMEYMVLAQAAYISLVTAKDSGYMDVDVKVIETADATDTINAACDTAIETYDLDHLITAACDTGPALVDHIVDNSILAFLFDDAGDISEYDDAKHSLVAIGDDTDTIVTAVGNIETDTAAYDTDAEYATAILNALTNAYGGAGTYGQAIEDILVDTGTTLDDLIDTEIGTIVTAVGNIETDTEMWDTTGEARTMLTGADTPVAKDSTPLTAAEAEAEAVDALESFHLDHLLAVDTTVAADGDLEAYCVAGSIMAHVLGTGADVTTYKASTDAAELSNLANFEAEAYDAIELANLDHWMKVVTSNSATLPEVVDDTVLANILTKTDGDTSDYDFTTDSFEAIRDQGDAAWTTGGGTGLTALESGTAQAGAAGTITLAAAESATNDIFNGCRVGIHTGTGAGQSRLIIDYDGGTKVATVHRNWVTNPANDSQYEILGSDTDVGWIEGGDATDAINAAADAAIVTYELDHLVYVADADDPADDSIVAKMFASDGDWSGADKTTDALEALRDRGDAAWTSSATAIIYTTYHVPFVIDIAGTVTIRFGMIIADAIDDLPTTGEITPGTIKIERKPINGTVWATIVNDEACLEAAGLIYYDEVLDTASGYREEDALRITFKSQKVSIGGNDFEITGTNGAVFHSYIRKALPDVIFRPW